MPMTMTVYGLLLTLLSTSIINIFTALDGAKIISDPVFSILDMLISFAVLDLLYDFYQFLTE